MNDVKAIALVDILRELRESGWRVAVHNDYTKDGQLWTFWLFSYGNWCVKGEATSDFEALRIVRLEIAKLTSRAGAVTKER